MQILLFGKTGQVAEELQRNGHKGIEIVALGRDEADLSKPDLCAKIISENNADVIINAAAYTLVEQAETEKTLANIINGESPSRMAEAAASKNIPFVHISTDYVFDGHGQESWKPEDGRRPLNAYGCSKLNGEGGVCGAGESYVILRTSWVFSAYGHNFVKTMLYLSKTQNTLRIVEDQIGGPTAASDIAKTCLIIAQALYSGREVSGTYHFSGSPDVSWADFSREIFAQTGRETIIENISTSDFPSAVNRPLNSRMNCFTLNSVFGIKRPNWRVSLNNVLEDLQEI